LDTVLDTKTIKEGTTYKKLFDYGDVKKIEEYIEIICQEFDDGNMSQKIPLHEDIPIPFSSEDLEVDIKHLVQNTSNPQWFEFLIARIRTLLNDERMNEITEIQEGEKLGGWLDQYIGNHKYDNKKIAIIDLSLIPSEIINIVTASIARIIFEALQRYRNLEGKVFPTCLVMEEAHTFVNRYSNEERRNTSVVCSQVFERIAREGRKFGLGLVLSSQRPSELSPTVLSQCNTFLLHRISNDRDQELVQRFVPDNLKGLLRELPSLPSQNAILMGWATEIPLMIRMNDLPEEHQPQSDDPDFWYVWTRKAERQVDWERIAADWQRRNIVDNQNEKEDKDHEGKEENSGNA
jgi:DNA helicase HerA-like ATPase